MKIEKLKPTYRVYTPMTDEHMQLLHDKICEQNIKINELIDAVIYLATPFVEGEKISEFESSNTK